MSNFDFYYKDILIATGGARLVNIKTAAHFLGRPVAYIYNSIWRNQFEIRIIKIGHNSFVTAVELAQFMAGGPSPKINGNSSDMKEVIPEIDALKKFVGSSENSTPQNETTDVGGAS